MADIIWQFLEKDKKDYYLHLLNVFGSLSGLFKDLSGVNGNKPYIYYRNHEIIFVRSFKAEDLSRKDSAFDAILCINNKNIGIGLKTWIHNSDLSSQKVAEFNKQSKLLRQLYEHEDIKDFITKVGQLRNERIEDDKRRNATNEEVYHIATRDNGVINIIETPYEKIDIENIRDIEKTDAGASFYDGLSHYSFNLSKTTLFKKFDVSSSQAIISIPVEIIEDPFLALENIFKDINNLQSESKDKTIFLPLYNDDTYKVDGLSKFNASLGKPKNLKYPNKRRPIYEAYAPIPVFIHYLYPGFFGIDALDKDEREESQFNLHLPTGEIITAKITQSNGKGLQSNPQSALGKWLLYNIFGLKPYQPLTRELIDSKGYDSIVVKKIDDKNFAIDLANYLDYEKWKLQHQEEIYELLKDKVITKSAIPTFRPQLFEDK